MSKICVLNCSNPETIQLESDVYVDYRDGRKDCFIGNERVKQTSSWHSWAYALETEFFVYGKDKWQGCFQYDGVIILCNRHIQEPPLRSLIKKLKLMKKKIAISFHEGGADLIGGSGIQGENLGSRWVGLTDLVKEADFYLNLFGQLSPMFEGWFGKEKVKLVHHATPLDWNHSLTIPFKDRPYDILIGTRTLNQRLPRNTFASLAALNGLATDLGVNVHYLSEDGDLAPLLARCGLSNIICHQGPLTWNEWIKFLSQFRLVVHFDQSLNLAQICYDAALVDVVPVGSTCFNNILCGTSDGGDLRNWSEMIRKRLTVPEMYGDYLDSFKDLVHPDAVKQELLRIFE